jgi:hypothetical protein
MLLNYHDRGNGCFQHCIWPLAQASMMSVATLSPFISRKSQNSSATIARSGTVVVPRGGSPCTVSHLPRHCCFFTLKPASTVLFFFAPKKHSNILYGVKKRLWESRSMPTLEIHKTSPGKLLFHFSYPGNLLSKLT